MIKNIFHDLEIMDWIGMVNDNEHNSTTKEWRKSYWKQPNELVCVISCNRSE